jgi:DNA-binding transcriptional MerR regulator
MSTPENGLDLSVVAPATEIPDKLYFRIGDVARLAGIKPYVLRFWETEFPALGPKKSGTGHRLYRRKDVEMVLEIKRLLYEQRFTIEGARKFLETRAKTEAAAAVKPSKRRAAKAATGVAAVASASGAGPTKGQADLFGDGPSSGTLELVRKELREILGLLK